MALSATIYKFSITVSDFNRDYYDSLQLTVAKHPSENCERMMARVLAYCLNANEGLEFTKGLSTPETPDIWQIDATGECTLWIEVGEPSVDKLKKACRKGRAVKVYSFNTKSPVWWQSEQSQMAGLPLAVYRIPWEPLQALAADLPRTSDVVVSINSEELSVMLGEHAVEFNLEALQENHEN